MNGTESQPKSCSVAGCNFSYLARGYCTSHWHQLWRRTASDDQLRYQYQSLQAAFDAWPKHVNENGCHVWLGNTSGPDGDRYGSMTYRNRRIKSHRAAYELAHGPIPPRHDIDHMCFEKLCVNPDHLRAVTRKQNTENRSTKSNKNSMTGHRGITYDANRGLYRARIKHHYKEIHVGRFETLDEAVSAVAAKRRELFTNSDMDRE